jgi:hypothetical protein
MTVRLRLALVAALVLLMPSLVSAQVWPSEMRRKFVDECLAGCTVNTKFTSVQRAECPPYCECMVKEAQGFMSTDDYTAFREATAASKATPFKERFEAMGGICGKRVFR